jgi:hypothetical protein
MGSLKKHKPALLQGIVNSSPPALATTADVLGRCPSIATGLIA